MQETRAPELIITVCISPLKSGEDMEDIVYSQLAKRTVDSLGSKAVA